jgi:hypothetical protein
VRQALSKHRNEPVVLAEDVGLSGVCPGLSDKSRDVDARVIGIGEQQWHDDGMASSRG